MEQNLHSSHFSGSIKALFSKNKVLQLLVHVIGITIVIVIPEVLLMQYFPEPAFSERPMLSLLVKVLVYAFVFYVNYFWVFDWTYVRRGKVMLYFAINIAVLLLASWMLQFFMHEFDHHVAGFGDGRPPIDGPASPHKPHVYGWFNPFIIRDFVVMTLVAALAVAVKLGQKSVEIKRHMQELESARQSIELASLKSQLNPHFLFNTLNSIYALVDIDSAKAKEAIYELSKMLRYMLYSATDRVTLKEEIELVERYIYLMRIRLSDASTIKVEMASGDSTQLLVAPLIFITLVENVFKHGDMASGGQAAVIKIEVVGNVVKFYSKNRVRPRVMVDSPGVGGIGLTNLRRRLKMLYGDKADLETLESDGFFTASMSIDLG